MKKVGISTVYTGYNYGSALQAYAVKCIIDELGYKSVLFGLRGNLIKGRDIRFMKVVVTAFRALTHSRNFIKSMSVYHSGIQKVLTKGSITQFFSFYKHTLAPVLVSFSELRKYGKSDDFMAFVCGSDQIWNSSVYYVDPFYYLQFAPINKRIAFAPSFGREFVPKYNEKKLKKYVSEIPYKSVREISGSKIINELTGELSEVLIDPTLVINADLWRAKLSLSIPEKKNRYILAYFLDIPTENAKNAIFELKKQTGYRVIGLPYIFEDMNWCDDFASAGPKEFVSLLQNASFVCTDSFHGTAFALNFNISFYSFERNYKGTEKQSTRIISILEKTGLIERFNPKIINSKEMEFGESNLLLSYERDKATAYLRRTLLKIKGDKR